MRLNAILSAQTIRARSAYAASNTGLAKNATGGDMGDEHHHQRLDGPVLGARRDLDSQPTSGAVTRVGSAEIDMASKNELSSVEQKA